jgi:guanylate kinase
MGKTPLARALRRFFPELSARLQPVVLCNSRSPRAGETDGVEHHFRPREEIERMRHDDRYVVVDVRGDLQALDVVELAQILPAGDAFYEGNPYVAQVLLTHPRLREVERLSIFLSPLSKGEIEFLLGQPDVSLRSLVTDVMHRKLRRRMRREKGDLSAGDLSEVERRATRAYDELRTAHHFDHVIANQDGEDSENWEAFPCPLGDARRTLYAVADLLAGVTPDAVEKWEAELLPE